MFQQLLSLCKALGMSSTTMGETPHSCRDITNLSCFGFFNSLTAGARQKNFSLIQWDRIARLCSAFNYLKGVTRRKMRVRKSCFSHITLQTRALEMPQLSLKIIQSSLKILLFSLFFDFQSSLDWRLTLLLYQKHINATTRVSRSRCIHYQKPNGLPSFGILQMNQRTSDNFHLLI